MLRKSLNPLSTCALPRSRPDVISAVLASLSARHAQDSRSIEIVATSRALLMIPIALARS